jgi:hypothetical protein
LLCICLPRNVRKICSYFKQWLWSILKGTQKLIWTQIPQREKKTFSEFLKNGIMFAHVSNGCEAVKSWNCSLSGNLRPG